MQEKHLFEYAVIRVVPLVEREEFLNVGVILYCSSQRFLKTIYQLDEQRLCIFPGIDINELEQRLAAFQKICNGGKQAGTIGQLPIAGRFRWLIATRSTIVQTSPVHPGFCTDANEKLATLFAQLVL